MFPFDREKNKLFMIISLCKSQDLELIFVNNIDAHKHLFRGECKVRSPYTESIYSVLEMREWTIATKRNWELSIGQLAENMWFL